MSLNNFKNFLEITSVSGDEVLISNYIIKLMSKYNPNYFYDKLGNLYFSFNSTKNAQKHICITTHIDEVGLLISKINNNGTLSFIIQGSFLISKFINSQVLITNGKNEKFYGVIYSTSAVTNLSNINDERNYIVDCGFLSKEDAEKHNVLPGNLISFVNKPKKLINNLVMGKNLQNRTNIYIIFSILKKLIVIVKQNNIKLSIGFLVQQQIGNRGSKVVDANLNADLYLNLDAVSSFETIVNNFNDNSFNHICLNNGPAILVYDRSYITRKNVLIFLEQIAKENEIPFQHLFCKSISSCGSVSMSQSGNLILPIVLPYRYNQSLNQIVSLKDVALLKKYLLFIVKKLTLIEISNLLNFYR